MADVTDPLPADRTGIDGADGLDTARRLQVGMSTRQCAGQVVVAPPRLTCGRIARDRAGRHLPGSAWLQGTR
jgi:hypothetical protein